MERYSPAAAVVGVRRVRRGDEVSLPVERKTLGDSFGLTRRELAVVSKIVAGGTNKTIASELAISEDAVKRHIATVFAKLDVSNRLELTLFAIYHQLIEPRGSHSE